MDIKEVINLSGTVLIEANEFTKTYYVGSNHLIISQSVPTENRQFYTNQDTINSFEMVLRGFQQHNCGKVIFHNKGIKGSLSGLSEYWEKDWNPRAVKAGYKAMAAVLSMDVFTRFSANFIINTFKNDGIKRRLFNDFEVGYKWIKKI